MTANFALFFFPALMAYAASSDLLTMKISNKVSIALVIGYLAFAIILGVPFSTIALHLSCGVAMLVITFAMFCFGWMGGGDAKLASATSVWLGWSLVVEYGLAASVLGGFLTLGLVYARGWPLPPRLMRHAWITRLHDSKTGIPYGIALALAGLIIYPASEVWREAFI